MTLRTCFAFFLCLFISASVSAQSKPLAELNTFPEIAAYMGQERNAILARNPSQKEYAIAIGDVLIPAGDRLLEIAQNSTEKRTAYNFKVQAWTIKVDAEIDGAEEQFNALLKQYSESDDPDAKMVAQGYRFRQFALTARRAEASPENFAQFKTDLKGWLNRNETSLSNIISLGLEVADSNKVPAEQFIEELIEHVQSPAYTASAADKEKLVQSLKGVLRLALGTEMELYGRTLDDKEFKWEPLREPGKEKYVLVQFTATWCGPCQMELPGMQEAYKKYKDKGFEIVSIYVWQGGAERDPIGTVKKYIEEKEIPWIVLSEELATRAGHPEYLEYYNLTGVPTMVLVDKSGKIIMTDARGVPLQNKLAEIFR